MSVRQLAFVESKFAVQLYWKQSMMRSVRLGPVHEVLWIMAMDFMIGAGWAAKRNNVISYGTTPTPWFSKPQGVGMHLWGTIYSD